MLVSKLIVSFSCRKWEVIVKGKLDRTCGNSLLTSRTSVVQYRPEDADFHAWSFHRSSITATGCIGFSQALPQSSDILGRLVAILESILK